MKIYIKLRLCISTFLMLSWFASNAQQSTINIEGTVIDKETNQGIPFAHVLVEATQVGVISNLYATLRFLL